MDDAPEIKNLEDDAPDIKNLENIINPHLEGGRLESYSSRYLTKPGDNYGSLMVAILANIRRTDGTIEELSLVAKLPPLTCDTLWNLFNPEVTALRESAIYEYVSPSLLQLQLDQGIPKPDLIDVLAKSYGFRISLDENATTVDRDAVLLLENLQKSGYRAGKRNVMFDYEHIRMVLKYVANFHALPIALRKLKPAKFDEVIRHRFVRFDIAAHMDPTFTELFKEQLLADVTLATDNECEAIKRTDELETMYIKYVSEKTACEDGLFTTLAHYDLWINNVMILYDEAGSPIKLKLVDFQITQYESLMHDVVFLLLTSVETNILEEQFHSLLKYYYDEFIACLNKLSVNTDEYSYEKFMEEFNRVAPIQVPHALYMAKVLLADDENAPTDFRDYDGDTFNHPASEQLLKKLREIIEISQQYDFFW